MFERPTGGEKVILVQICSAGKPNPDEHAEFTELAASSGAVIVDQLISSRRRPDPRYFIGKGKLKELAQVVKTKTKCKTKR